MTDRARVADARHRAYALVGRLVVDGLVPEVVPAVQALPDLAAAWDARDPDHLAAEHHRVLSLEVFPWESVFRGDDARMGGPVEGAVAAAWARAGLSSGRADVAPDHLGMELAHLAWLCAAERDALRDGHPQAADRVRALARSFLSEHVLAWLPAALAAILQSESVPYAAVARLVAELVAHHAAELDAAPEAPPAVDPGALLDDPRTRLKDVAGWLLVPAKSGVFLSSARIASVAARAGVPAGFGSRLDRLEGVLFAGVDRRALPAVLGALSDELSAWEARYRELAEVGLPCGGWRARLVGSRGLLDRVAAATPGRGP